MVKVLSYWGRTNQPGVTRRRVDRSRVALRSRRQGNRYWQNQGRVGPLYRPVVTLGPLSWQSAGVWALE